MFFCISRTSLASGGHGREDGAAEPALSHKKAMALLVSDYAYWYYIAGSPPLDALLLILGKTLTVVNKNPESHGFIGRRISSQLYFLWVKNPEMLEDARLLTPISHRDVASTVEESLATFPVYLPLGVFLAQNPQILESTLRKLKPSFDAAFRGRFARIIPETSEELVRLIRSFSDHGKLTLSSGTVFEEESALVISDLPLGTAAAALQQESPDSPWLRQKM